VIRFDKEKYFSNPKSGQQEKFPTIDDEPTIDLSVIVPAYDEQDRRKLQTNLL
jgi:dolichyl-phosphate beta-glucosyltransferase